MAGDKRFTAAQKRTAINFVIEEISSGNFLGVALKNLKEKKKISLSRAQFYRWHDADDHNLHETYARARRLGAESLFEELKKISEEIEKNKDSKMFHALIQEARLKIDVVKWMIGKISPKEYSDFSRQSFENPDGSGLLSELAEAIREVTGEETDAIGK